MPWCPDFPFESEKEKTVLTRRPGDNHFADVLDDEDLDADRILARLQPYKCAVMQQVLPSEGPTTRRENRMTARQVSTHIYHGYPMERMYTIIDGYIYDLSGKCSLSTAVLFARRLFA